MIENTGFGEGAVYDPDGGEGTEGSCSCMTDGCSCTGCDTHYGTKIIRAWQTSAAMESVA